MATDLSALKINPLKKALNPLGAITEQANTNTPAPFSSSYDPLQSAMAHGKEIQSKIDEHVASQTQPTGMPSIDFSGALSGQTAQNDFMQGLKPKAPAPTGGGEMPPTPEAQPLPNSPINLNENMVASEQQPVAENSGFLDSLVPKASAQSELTDDEIRTLINEGYSDEEIMKANEDLKTMPEETKTEEPQGLDKLKFQSSEKFGAVEGLKDIGKFFANVPADSAQVVKGLWDVVTSPIQTAKGLVKTGKWLSDKAVYGIANAITRELGGKEVPPTEEADMIDAIGSHIKETYGTAGKFKKAVVENPADTLLTLMGWLGAVSKVAEAGGYTNVVNNINKIQEVINPVNVLKQEAKLVTTPIGATWKLLKKTWETLYKTAVKPTTQEAEKILKFKAWLWEKPVTVAETGLKKWIAGTETRMGVQALKEADAIFKRDVNPILEKSTTEHSLSELFKKAESRIDNMKEWELRKAELKEGLEALKEDYNAIWKDKFTTKTLQQEKSSLDKFTPDKVFKGKPIASAYNESKNILANVFRNEVHTDLGKYGLKSQEAFRDYANLQELAKVWVKWLTEWGLRGWFGGFWTTMYDQIATPIKTIGGQILYKVWDKLEFIWPKGINKMGDLLKDKFSLDKNGILSPKYPQNVSDIINSGTKNLFRNDKPVVEGTEIKPSSTAELFKKYDVKKWKGLESMPIEPKAPSIPKSKSEINKQNKQRIQEVKSKEKENILKKKADLEDLAFENMLKKRWITLEEYKQELLMKAKKEAIEKRNKLIK